MGDVLVQTESVGKEFSSVWVLRGITVGIRAGEILGLIGENGAGKSTLMKILYGLYRPNAGVIRVHGSEVRFRSPHDAIAAGIGMVHQHFMLVAPFSVTDNISHGT